MHQRAQAGIAYLPQEASVFRKLSVADNIRLVMELNGRGRKEIRERGSEPCGVAGVRAALCNDLYTARMAREHNDANVLCLSADLLGQTLIEKIVDTWLKTEFEGGRHARRPGDAAVVPAVDVGEWTFEVAEGPDGAFAVRGERSGATYWRGDSLDAALRARARLASGR